MEYLSKDENKKAYESYLFSRIKTKALTEDEIIQKFKELFLIEPLTDDEKRKYRDTIDFTIGGARASYNRDKTAVIMCEMPSSLTLGLTRNMSIVDLSDKTEYSLRYGKGYKTIRNFIKSL